MKRFKINKMTIPFAELTLADLLTIEFGRVDGDRGVVIVGKEARL